MEHADPVGGKADQARIGYFLVHVHAAAGPHTQVGVVMEDLGSGVKHRFETAQAVGEFLDGWARTPSQPRIP